MSSTHASSTATTRHSTTGHQPQHGDDQHGHQQHDRLSGPTGQSRALEDPFEVDGDGHKQQPGQRGRGTGPGEEQLPQPSVE